MSGVIAGIDPKLLHAGQECCPIYAQTRGSSVHSAHSSLSLGECAHDLIAVFFSTIIRGTAASM